jgi:hypothetical protein
MSTDPLADVRGQFGDELVEWGQSWLQRRRELNPSIPPGILDWILAADLEILDAMLFRATAAAQPDEHALGAKQGYEQAHEVLWALHEMIQLANPELFDSAAPPPRPCVWVDNDGCSVAGPGRKTSEFVLDLAFGAATAAQRRHTCRALVEAAVAYALELRAMVAEGDRTWPAGGSAPPAEQQLQRIAHLLVDPATVPRTGTEVADGRP